jgi:hypothetical protein
MEDVSSMMPVDRAVAAFDDVSNDGESGMFKVNREPTNRT